MFYVDNDRIDAIEKELEKLKNARPGTPPAPIEMPVVSSGPGGPDLESLLKIFATKDAPDKTLKRIYDLEQMMDAMQKRMDGIDDALGGLSQLDGISDLGKMCKDLADRLKKVEDRTDGQDLDLKRHQEEIDALKAALSGMNTAGGSVSGDIDGNALMMRLNMLTEEVKRKADKNDLEKLRLELKQYTDEEVNKLRKEISDSLEGLRFEIERLRAEFENFKNRDFQDLVNRVSTLEKRVSTLVTQFGNFKMPESTGSGGVSEAQFRALEARVAALENELHSLKNEFAKWMKELQDALNGKADLSSLTELEKLLMERLNEIVKALTKQFADKNETKRALKLLERQLKNLYDLFMSKGGGSNEEDAMFSKKPLGGLSCASCEKDLVNMYGKRIEFMPWSKLPFRDPSERIARVGQGFSKMLSMINPDQLSRYEQANAASKMHHDQMMHQHHGGIGASADQFYGQQPHEGMVDE